MLRNLILGQYVYKKSLIHKLDPRTKILVMVFISISLFLIKSYYNFIFATIFVIVVALISQIKLKNIFKNLRPFLFFFIFILLMYALFSKNELTKGIITIWRFVLLIIIASMLTFSTTISDLVLAFEKLLIPLKIIKIKARDIAIMISITLRFIPLFFLESIKIRDAKLSRLANLKKLKHIKLIILPLLERLFKRASNLSDAMESKCYRNYGYSNFKELKLDLRDYITITIITGGALLWILT